MLSFIVLFAAVLIFGGLALTALWPGLRLAQFDPIFDDPTPRSIFETRRAGLA